MNADPLRPPETDIYPEFQRARSRLVVVGCLLVAALIVAAAAIRGWLS